MLDPIGMKISTLLVRQRSLQDRFPSSPRQIFLIRQRVQQHGRYMLTIAFFAATAFAMDSGDIGLVQIDPHIDPDRPRSRDLDEGSDQSAVLANIGQGDPPLFQLMTGSLEGRGVELILQVMEGIAHDRPF